MLKHLMKIIDTSDANDEESMKIEDIGSRVTNFKEMTKRMSVKYTKYYETSEKMSTLVYTTPIFDLIYKLVDVELFLYVKPQKIKSVLLNYIYYL